MASCSCGVGLLSCFAVCRECGGGGCYGEKCKHGWRFRLDSFTFVFGIVTVTVVAMMRRRASSARVPKALRAASVQNYVVLSSDAAISRSTMIAGAVIALLGLIAGFLVLSRGPLPVVQLDTPRRELVIGKGLNPNHDVPSVLKRAEKYLQLVDDWVYSPISDADAARKYLRDHPRMSKHVSAFTQVRLSRLLWKSLSPLKLMLCCVDCDHFIAACRLLSKRFPFRPRSLHIHILYAQQEDRWRSISLQDL
jgi:hypothetical protein